MALGPLAFKREMPNPVGIEVGFVRHHLSFSFMFFCLYLEPFFRPDLANSHGQRAQGLSGLAVSIVATHSGIARPHLDRSEHDATLAAIRKQDHVAVLFGF